MSIVDRNHCGIQKCLMGETYFCISVVFFFLSFFFFLFLSFSSCPAPKWNMKLTALQVTIHLFQKGNEVWVFFRSRGHKTKYWGGKPWGCKEEIRKLWEKSKIWGNTKEDVLGEEGSGEVGETEFIGERGLLPLTVYQDPAIPVLPQHLRLDLCARGQESCSASNFLSHLVQDPISS